MAHYRFYFMVGTMIMLAEDANCPDDGHADAMAVDRLRATEATYDAIEVWQAARQVCRHERAGVAQRRC